ncbi:probable 2-polyprenyl-6-methoxyphenol hydroxylase and related FAD-dependent oxidoreductases [Rhynchosporium secalis]|uniref:Probable 2-polyprenyl-6-methoxyphenol hydroxylase and related FAD-dependent oxidoreductases n=1 Tax=Rhynchosporium secalis TaxID=38038 RepID=A0A1E1MWN7_RHYSE|nr:probable 2-polyprenyl-6-methoxyphenol hydroxylase and related FAD-dependent oxidoreductases [Rhynchosporium secalis]
MTQKFEVIICGSGSAGLCAGVWLARHGITCKILEKRPGPMKMGQADGVQCRTVEMFESLGLSEDLLRESYHVLEVAFWDSDENGNIVRTSRAADTMPGLSHQPHVILNQAIINGFLMKDMERSNDQGVNYGYTVKSVEVDSALAEERNSYPVRVVASRDGKDEVMLAKYVLGCDGAHSEVRRSLGFKMIGDSTDTIWGVMDIYPRTNFPDIRRKATVRSRSGNIVIIPREGGSLVRFYIQLPAGTNVKEVTLDDLHKTARQIFLPHTMEFAETAWWSAYAIGQRLADHFSKDNRVFLTGDACHTHSPKAGQGMNVSLQDGFNIGWKLAAVLQGRAPSSLLKTYNIEREKVAADLIAFDRSWSKLFSSQADETNGYTAQYFSEQFIKSGKYTAGLTAKYDDSMITCSEQSKPELASSLTVGMRFPSAQVVRFCDARAMQLVRALPADGRWRIVIFAGNVKLARSKEKLEKLAAFLSSHDGPARRFTQSGADIDSFIESIVVFQGRRIEMEQEQIPDCFWPATGKWAMRDLHKTFFDDESYNSGHGKVYERYGIDINEGAVVVIRPDQYISLITSMDDNEGISRFFERFAISI